MDRKYGGDPLAPPRPPKSIPRIHRQRLPEPPIMNANPFQQILLTQQQQQNQSSQNQALNIESTQLTGPPLQPRNQQIHQQPPPLPPQTNHQQSHNLSPITVPLTSLHSLTNSFSRRRSPPPGTVVPTISSISSSTASSPLPIQPSTLTNSQNQETQISAVTLAAPRPEKERLANEYVDTPFRTPKLASRSQHPFPQYHQAHDIHSTTHPLGRTISSASPANTNQTVTPDSVIHTSVTTKPLNLLNNSSTQIQSITSAVPVRTITTTITTASRPSVLPIPAITKQPVPFTKDLATAALHDDIDLHSSHGETLNSITCPQCRRCRCEECQRPRQLPSKWICDNTCLCSAETIIDYTSCLCCVKALFYHCSKDHEIECEGDIISCADDPCSCLPHKRTQRWAWLSALSIALPCLWCYWPMRGCVAICEKCYARHSRHGCRCPQQTNKLSTGISNAGSNNNSGTNSGRTIIRTSDLAPEKRLLDSSPEF